jgi:hypothetical protein
MLSEKEHKIFFHLLLSLLQFRTEPNKRESSRFNCNCMKQKIEKKKILTFAAPLPRHSFLIRRLPGSGAMPAGGAKQSLSRRKAEPWFA